MTPTSALSPVRLAQVCLLITLLGLLFFFREGTNFIYSVLALALLAGYHLFLDRRLSIRQIPSAGWVGLHVGIYLLLCALFVWLTTDQEESVFWIIFLLPIVVSATHLGLGATLATSAAAGGLFWGTLPSRFYQETEFRAEELPEILVFILTFFLVGILIQAFSEQIRRQLLRQTELNGELVARQQELSESLQRLEVAEESLRRRERMAALGEMAAGIAHEIRNPLGIVSSSAQMLSARFPSEAEEGGLLGIIGEETARMNRLITDFLAFGRPREPDLHPCDLRDLLERSVAHIRTLAEAHDIAAILNLPAEPQPARLDAGMIGQVFLNLLLNALDATPPGGRVTVRLGREQGRYRVEVHDTGSGIPDDLRGKIFTPFFTTKDGGTGLGLANAYRMVERHGGELQLGMSTAEGTSFVVYLPREEV